MRSTECRSSCINIAETTTELKLPVEEEQLRKQDQQDAAAADATDDSDARGEEEEEEEEDKVAEDEQQNDEPMSVPRPRRKTVNVGSAAVLDCDVDYPLTAAGSPAEQRYVQHIVTWRKQGVEAPVFIAFDGYPPRVDASYAGRVRAVGPAAIEIGDVRTSDAGWYECTVLFIDEGDESPSNGTWTYLAVNSMSAHLFCTVSLFTLQTH